jgi:hypothetical protein
MARSQPNQMLVLIGAIAAPSSLNIGAQQAAPGPAH